MKSSVILFLYAAQTVLGGTLNQRAACNADNCARAVTGTQAGPSQVTKARADCSSFLLDTVTPAAVTSTATATVTSTSTSTATVTGSTSYSIIGTGTATPAYPNKRDATPAPVPAEDVEIAVRQVTVVPSSVPTYASACSGSVRYSSACSCWGITASTTTAATPTISTTVTVTSTTTTVVATTTVSVTIGVCAASDNYGLNYNGGYVLDLDGQMGASADGYSTDADTPLDCCSECYSTVGCYSYGYSEYGCYLYVTTGGTSPSATPFCPNGNVAFITSGQNNSFGFGPCSTPVA